MPGSEEPPPVDAALEDPVLALLVEACPADEDDTAALLEAAPEEEARALLDAMVAAEEDTVAAEEDTVAAEEDTAPLLDTAELDALVVPPDDDDDVPGAGRPIHDASSQEATSSRSFLISVAYQARSSRTSKCRSAHTWRRVHRNMAQPPPLSPGIRAFHVAGDTPKSESAGRPNPMSVFWNAASLTLNCREPVRPPRFPSTVVSFPVAAS